MKRTISFPFTFLPRRNVELDKNHCCDSKPHPSCVLKLRETASSIEAISLNWFFLYGNKRTFESIVMVSNRVCQVTVRSPLAHTCTKQCPTSTHLKKFCCSRTEHETLFLRHEILLWITIAGFHCCWTLFKSQLGSLHMEKQWRIWRCKW